jgi:hypothetical protein
MSAITAVSSSANVTYATQLAQSSALRRSLNNLGVAVQSGDLSTAGSVLTALQKAHPEYAASSAEGTQSVDPINQSFQTLANAISSNEADAARSAWTQIKADLAKEGVTDISDGTAATAKLLEDSKDSIAQQILSDTFGTSSGSPVTINSLLSGSSKSSSEALSNSLMSDWVTYRAGGKTSLPPAVTSAGRKLDTAA